MNDATPNEAAKRVIDAMCAEAEACGFTLSRDFRITLQGEAITDGVYARHQFQGEDFTASGATFVLPDGPFEAQAVGQVFTIKSK